MALTFFSGPADASLAAFLGQPLHSLMTRAKRVTPGR
jgi:hypothetical protein